MALKPACLWLPPDHFFRSPFPPKGVLRLFFRDNIVYASRPTSGRFVSLLYPSSPIHLPCPHDPPPGNHLELRKGALTSSSNPPFQSLARFSPLLMPRTLISSDFYRLKAGHSPVGCQAPQRVRRDPAFRVFYSEGVGFPQSGCIYSGCGSVSADSTSASLTREVCPLSFNCDPSAYFRNYPSRTLPPPHLKRRLVKSGIDIATLRFSHVFRVLKIVATLCGLLPRVFHLVGANVDTRVHAEGKW